MCNTEKNVSNTCKILRKIELVQNVSEPNVLKISGEDIKFARPVDEFSRYLISEIPNMFRYLKAASNLDGLSEESKESILSDIKAYVKQVETVSDIYLQESKCKELLENKQ